MKSVICFLIGAFGSLLINAQDWPALGATWYFDQEYGLCFGREYSKWQYVGDSLKPEGRKLNFVRDVAKLNYPAPGVINKTFFQESQFFIDRNDSLFYGNSFLIADFTRVTGDSTFSPFQDLQLDPFCSENDSLLVLQKSLVTAHGLQTVGNRSFKWYRIQYLSVSPEDQSLILAEMEFHQRYFTPERWFLPTADWIFCGSIFEYCYEVFQCYHDDLMPPATCSSAAYEWQHLSIKDDTEPKSVLVFPNPVSDWLNLVSSDFEMTYTGYLSDIYGRKVIEIRPAPYTETVVIPMNHLPAGIYVLNLTDSKGNIHSEKIIKN
jgi:hypothetical protein